jgi:predicted dehydrogenase
VKGLTGSFDRVLRPLDTAVATFELEGGALGTWTSCYSARYQGPLLRVYGSRANAELGRDAVLEDHRGRRTVFRPRRDSFVAEFQHFADMVQKGKAPQITPDEALSDLIFAQRILEGR